MRAKLKTALASFGLLSLNVLAVSAQYLADVTVTGGKHAGHYLLTPRFEQTPPGCMLGKTDTGGYLISMTDLGAGMLKSHLSNLTLGFEDAAKAASSAGTPNFRFALSFVDPSVPPLPGVSYSTMEKSPPPGAPTLKFNFVYGEETFKSTFSAVVLQGADTVRVNATVNCKAVNR